MTSRNSGLGIPFFFFFIFVYSFHDYSQSDTNTVFFDLPQTISQRHFGGCFREFLCHDEKQKLGDVHEQQLLVFTVGIGQPLDTEMNEYLLFSLF